MAIGNKGEDLTTFVRPIVDNNPVHFDKCNNGAETTSRDDLVKALDLAALQPEAVFVLEQGIVGKDNILRLMISDNITGFSRNLEKSEPEFTFIILDDDGNPKPQGGRITLTESTATWSLQKNTADELTAISFKRDDTPKKASIVWTRIREPDLAQQ